MNAMDEVGGDPVCWIDRVCPECGRFQDDRDAPVCQSCGAPRETGGAVLPETSAPAPRNPR
jgi:NMD protein affecting ribosome stability and mRNA decay